MRKLKWSVIGALSLGAAAAFAADPLPWEPVPFSTQNAPAKEAAAKKEPAAIKAESSADALLGKAIAKIERPEKEAATAQATIPEAVPPKENKAAAVINPFTGQSASYEQKLRKLDEAQIETKILQEALNQENLRMQTELMQHKKRSEIARMGAEARTLQGALAVAHDPEVKKDKPVKNVAKTARAPAANVAFIEPVERNRVSGSITLGDESYVLVEDHGLVKEGAVVAGVRVGAPAASETISEMRISDSQPAPSTGGSAAGPAPLAPAPMLPPVHDGFAYPGMMPAPLAE